MKILASIGSGIGGGNTEKLTDAFLRGAEEAGHFTTRALLGDMKFEGCRGCGACQRGDKGCVVRDDMQKLYPLIEEHDLLVFASPLYFWTISGRLKSCIDRFYAISREDKYPHKNTVLLMTAGDKTSETFRLTEDYYDAIVKALGWTDMGKYLQGDCIGCEKDKRFISEDGLKAAFELGKSIQ